ncbi:cupin domain-containing protein [Rhodopirellula baltica]|uniref:Cupin 2 conserved barrel domain protein n=1 Tax=Rhodopirellula baltica WH47 TaxID=991778 RepID=F2B137_RHOBT|nr:cupin domain-containing protein [Rhodopirellula baltica]EGF24389.1 Cupin 2 conserved barrel domain protein [Rhodopirellula baltica WH47]
MVDSAICFLRNARYAKLAVRGIIQLEHRFLNHTRQPVAKRRITPGVLTMAILHASPGTVIDVRPLKEQIFNAKTQVLVKTDALEVIRLVLPAGKTISEHQAPSEITFQVLEGTVQFTCHGKPHELSAGEMLFLGSREPHTVIAVADSTVLLTMLMGK